MDNDAVATATNCPLCGFLQRVEPPGKGYLRICAQCGCRLQHHRPNSVNRTLAFAAAALLMYVPANLLPIMTFEYYGAAEPATVWSGVITLAERGMWGVAGVIFAASIVVPLVKLSSLFLLALTFRSGVGRAWKTKLYRVIRAVGPWAMLDVFLLAVLVGAVKLGQLATITPGPAAVPFTMVVVFTILATECFDPSLLWQQERSSDRQEAP